MKIRLRLFGLVLLSVLTAFFSVKTDAVAEDLSAKQQVIVIDPGHGGIDGGAQSADGTLEKTLNLQFARKLKEVLTAKGFTVYMTREEDVDCTQHAENAALVKSRHRRDLMGRVQFAKQHQATMIISIHANTGTRTNKGPIVICQPENPVSLHAAQLVQNHFNRMTGLEQHIVKGKRLYLLSHSEAPVLLIEIGFLSNPADVRQLLSDSYQEKLSAAIVAGLSEHFLTRVAP